MDYLLAGGSWFHMHDLARTHARLHTQWRAICLKWENNEPQGVSIKFISCTVPQVGGRWGPPLCTYFHKSSCVMTLPRCKWTGWGQQTERLDWWRPFLEGKKTKHVRPTWKSSFWLQAEATSNISKGKKKLQLSDVFWSERPARRARRPSADQRGELKV